ncbi:CocE/NonD family hydrolase [Nocardioides terrisoli]|uniref:CocE/NonD family hydrolase n=1 Tax=Nocardioides terrisoli TaxID=3388267 RepID=UPI00287BB514|nr:CocE/NonD family hydrolase [Nocardioides marmorisolisilvae]
MRRATALITALLLGTPLTVAAATTTAGATPAPYTVTTLHFAVHLGPNSMGDPQNCDIIGDLYTPAVASPTHRVPAILTTNGFGGSKDDQAGIGKAFATRGFEVLSYSGLGFGGSGCKITLDDPSTDGRAASQLVSYLGGASGIAFTDAKHTTPAPVLNVVRLDGVDHAGRHVAHDPRVGMVGGSYGGEIQFATAAIDPRVDTIVPIITWNDLSYSLAPNNTSLDAGVTPSTPGATKLVWGLGFSAEGVADGIEGMQTDPSRIPGCPNFATFVCPALVTAGSTGFFQPSAIAALRHASVVTYMPRIRIPVLLMQGENDTLFNLNEAAATYRALRAQGTPVKMIWQSWGHSSLTAAPGEIDLDNPDPTTQYETKRVLDWFTHYLLDRPTVSTGPAFSYFRPWVDYTGIATPAYAASSAYPVGQNRTWFLSASSLVTSTKQVVAGSQRVTTPPAGLPTSIDPTDAAALFFSGANQLPNTSLPGTTATWTTAPLSSPLDVVGAPTVRLKVDAPTAVLSQAAGAAGKVVLFLKVVDVDAGGKASMLNGEIAPVRIPDVREPFTVRMPAIVHRFAPGHRLALVVAAGSQNYRGGLPATPVTIAAGSGQRLTLPVTN